VVNPPAPPAVTPPAVTPPAVTPPVVNPPVVTPPVVDPPVVTPPVVTPPVVTPPTVTPPAVVAPSNDTLEGKLTSDRYANSEIPDWAKIEWSPPRKPGEPRVIESGVIECMVAGGHLVVSQTIPGGRKGHLLSGCAHATAKRTFVQNYNLMLHNESVEDWKGKVQEDNISLGLEYKIELVAQSSAKTVVILFYKDDTRPLLFTASMIKNIWGTNGHTMLKQVMQNLGQTFLSRSDLKTVHNTNMDSQKSYMRLRSEAVLQANQERERRSATSPAHSNDPVPEEVQRAMDTLRKHHYRVERI
jgi:hypothetical protein